MLGPLGDAIEMKLEAAFPAALMISVVDQSMASLGADLGKIESLEDGRFTVFIMDTTFVDKTAEERQGMVREGLKDEMPRIAELNLKTRAPGELRQKTETRLQSFFFLFQKQRNSPTVFFFLISKTEKLAYNRFFLIWKYKITHSVVLQCHTSPFGGRGQPSLVVCPTLARAGHCRSIFPR